VTQEPSDPTNPQEREGERATASLRNYVAEHGGEFTDDALTRALGEAGHKEDDIRAALAAYRAAEAGGPVRSRAIRAIAIAYVAVYVVLSLGMLANSRPQGYLMPDSRGGIVLLTVSLVVAFVASLIWVASRRAFGIVFFALLTLGSFTGIGPLVASPESIQPLVFLPPAIGIVGLIWLLRRRTAGNLGGGAGFGVLLAIPIVLLLGVGGLCVASGMPLPGGA
jgi:hypothetical protein